MHVPDVLRDARRRHGLSVRAAALRCGVPRATWAAWEAGRTTPSAVRLDALLAGLGLDLRLVPRPAEPAGVDAVRRHLRRSLTERARLALGEQLDAVLAACRERPRSLTGPAAVGVWVPEVVARGPLPLPAAAPGGGVVAVRLDLQERGGPARAVVAFPGALLAEGAASTWPGLLTSARLLQTEAPRDLAGRRLPAHRDPDEDRELRDLGQTLMWGGRGGMPVAEADSRGWRLGAAASLDEVLRSKGLPARHAEDRGYRYRPGA